MEMVRRGGRVALERKNELERSRQMQRLQMGAGRGGIPI